VFCCVRRTRSCPASRALNAVTGFEADAFVKPTACGSLFIDTNLKEVKSSREACDDKRELGKDIPGPAWLERLESAYFDSAWLVVFFV